MKPRERPASSWTVTLVSSLQQAEAVRIGEAPRTFALNSVAQQGSAVGNDSPGPGSARSGDADRSMSTWFASQYAAKNEPRTADCRSAAGGSRRDERKCVAVAVVVGGEDVLAVCVDQRTLC